MPRRADDHATTTSSNPVANPTTVSEMRVWSDSAPDEVADAINEQHRADDHGGQSGEYHAELFADAPFRRRASSASSTASASSAVSPSTGGWRSVIQMAAT